MIHDVVLVDFRSRFEICPIAGARLKSWSMADPRLRDAARIEVIIAHPEETVEAVTATLAALEPAVAGFSCYIWNYSRTFETIRRLKRDSPKTFVILGGPFAEALAEQVLTENPGIDVIVIGEGEETFRRLLRHRFFGEESLSALPGLCLRGPKGALRTGEAAEVGLDQLAPVYSEEVIPPDRGWRSIVLEASRGCPLQCTFCAWDTGMRYMPLTHLEKEFACMAGRTSIFFLSDSDLLLNRKRGVEVMELFLKATAGYGCKLSFQTNPTFLCREIVDVIARAPEKFQLECGLQSIEAEVLETVDRACTLPRIEANLADLRRRAPEAAFKFSIIYGLPKDSLDGYRRTLDWTLRMRPGWVISHHALALPGTKMRKDARELGLVYSPRAPWQVLETPTMSTQDFAAARRLALWNKLFFTIGSALDLVEPVLGLAEGGRPLAHVEAFESWIDFLEDQGVAAAAGAPPSACDPLVFDGHVDATIERLRRDKLAQASIVLATRRFASRRQAAA